MEPLYVCYDLRGIQSFIFKTSRLKYIVGGSAIVDRFDREVVPELARRFQWESIFSAGGKGAFRAPDHQTAEEVQAELKREAHSVGLDIRFGRDVDYSEAAHSTSRVFPYLPDPEDLDGHPCPESGLYPVQGNQPHKIIQARIWNRGERMDRWFESRLGLTSFPLRPNEPSDPTAFMHDVGEGQPGFRSLGGRNRWAVICMDGNDMGRHFQAMAVRGESPQRFLEWLQRMSAAMDECTVQACKVGMERALAEWTADEGTTRALANGELTDSHGDVILPLRPLVVGGDDITVLCHAAHATSFVEAACAAFTSTSRELAAKAKTDGIADLWTGTGDHITISAGILYCGTTLPLATAIPYAHDLLSLAKEKGRKLIQHATSPSPAPACVDFEAVTESLLDTPRARRERELVFLDADLNHTRVELTRRPYLVDELIALDSQLRRLELPTSILHKLLPGLRQGHADRQIFYARLGKHNKRLFEALDERNIGREPCRWQQGEGIRWIDVIDMAILAKENRRMTSEVSL